MESTIHLEPIGKDYQMEASVREHFIVLDEPAEKGGGNTGPTPGELLATALAGCTAITLRMYTNRKGWQLNDIKVDVKKEYHSDPEKQYKFTTTIYVSGADENQREKLLIIAKKCPVHKALKDGNEVLTSLTTL